MFTTQKNQVYHICNSLPEKLLITDFVQNAVTQDIGGDTAK